MYVDRFWSYFTVQQVLFCFFSSYVEIQQAKNIDLNNLFSFYYLMKYFFMKKIDFIYTSESTISESGIDDN